MLQVITEFLQQPLGAGLIGVFLGFLGTSVKAWVDHSKTRLDVGLQRDQLVQDASQSFQATILSEFKEAKATIALHSERIHSQALQIASLTAKVEVLQHSEALMRSERDRLAAEVQHLRVRNEELDDENEAQGERLAHLTGEKTALEAQVERMRREYERVLLALQASERKAELLDSENADQAEHLTKLKGRLQQLESELVDLRVGQLRLDDCAEGEGNA